MMGSGQSLTLANLACARSGRLLFSKLSLTLGAGEAALVSGPNGIGKSSLLRLIAGLLTPAAGLVTVNGRIALTSETTALDRAQPLGKALGFWAAMDGGVVETGLTAMGIAHLATVPVRILSTGQKKRAVIAGVIAGGAPIWLLDEPANGLDIASIALLEQAIATHRANGGIVVVASHQPIMLADAKPVVLA
ncbi:MAG: heme ABC exporter ATP-binding protein CcmA [Sphingomonadaceae bacterium]